ncbi:glycerol-3-phosphate acyltransferase PlsX [Williamsoniiplasma somnilux]|uniref:Phosphate acyltransferase n=1 Tax=Williamsoniiplasma somnilux TaxID=215578 RepID=A0A2K8NXU0_9MOLU|nr:phosphate acyltransferase PlsX [Williamsoniiplasma somnilux]ATZ18607.1 glycerol-3-phosphate acyltransferase PlsX [Williamsoniiplasma somnilux]
MYKIAFDVMGSDHGSKVAIQAASEFLKDKNDLVIIFVGDKAEIESAIKEFNISENKYEILATTETIDMNGSILDVRRKKDASMVKALELVKNKKVDGMLTAGSSAAFLGGSHFIIGEFDGVSRPAFMPTWPTIKNNTTLFLDAGANLENTSQDLHTYAQLATIYAKTILNIKKPKVGLLNVGIEESKGKDLQKETYKLLKEDKSINFFGNIESREMISGEVDIIVTDGFSGNIALKSMEGSLKNMMSVISKSMKKNLFRKLRAVLLLKAFKEVAETFDYKNHAGAILLGVDGIVFKSHGSSDVKSFRATLRMTYAAITGDVLTKMKKELTK